MNLGDKKSQTAHHGRRVWESALLSLYTIIRHNYQAQYRAEYRAEYRKRVPYSGVLSALGSFYVLGKEGT